MIQILENTSLKKLNTFGIDVNAQYLCLYNTPDDLRYLITEGPLQRDMEMIILGSGSNQLFTETFNGVVIHPVNDSLEVVSEDADHVYLKAGAGLEWDALVNYAVTNGWGGIENLSNIPGSVGAAPVQNIGAYGTEVKDCIHQVHLVSFSDGTLKTISQQECKFGYRDSIFKHQFKNRYLVDSVTFKLNKKPVFNTQYGAVSQELEKMGEVSLQNIRKAIIEIRGQKLPCPTEIGNAGSFFKNPMVPECEALQIKQKFPELPTYKTDNGMVKLAAGWLIEQCGLKGFSLPNGKAGIHKNQALVLVNLGNATGQDILEVARIAQVKVFEKFDINLEPEVIINK
ncbi:MAG: UDP-N-acetylmuramate dehydrogenase [Salinivirgaceae bacterium]|nr:UDP-N-acetylmuramate dehydrogenase [Salinivirgaceae bacterium]